MEDKLKKLEHAMQHVLNYRLTLERNMNYLKHTTDVLINENKQLRESLSNSNNKITELEVKISNLELAQFVTTPSKF